MMDEWPEGISDGLTLPCAICLAHPVKFDFAVTDELWRMVVPEQPRRGVVCLPCYNRLATEKGIDWANGLEQVQFTGAGKTIRLVPEFVYRYGALAEAEEE